MATFVMTLFIVICVLLIIIVLLQKGRGGGLGAALGGMSTSAFGTRTGDVFTWVTVVLVSLYLLLAVGTALYLHPEAEKLDMPQFNPVAAEYDSAKSVMITVPHTKGSDTRIHYTLDGSTPRENSPQFKGTPVMVEPGTTLKAVAFASGKLASDPAIGVYGKVGDRARAAAKAAAEAAAASQPAEELPLPSTLPSSGPSGLLRTTTAPAPAAPAAKPASSPATAPAM